MAKINKPQILENLFWRCNEKVDCDIDAEMLRLKTIEGESKEVYDEIYKYLAMRLGYGTYEVNHKTLECAGWLEKTEEVAYRHEAVKLADLANMVHSIDITRAKLLEIAFSKNGIVIDGVEISVGLQGKTARAIFSKQGERIAYHYQFPIKEACR